MTEFQETIDGYSKLQMDCDGYGMRAEFVDFCRTGRRNFRCCGVRSEFRIQGDCRRVREENRAHREAILGLVRELLCAAFKWRAVRSVFFGRHRLSKEIGGSRAGRAGK